MRTSVWYRTEEKSPDRRGYYLAYRGFGMGGALSGDHEYGYLYYDKQTDKWYDYNDRRNYAIVYYWTNATPDAWTNADPPSIKIRNSTTYKGTLHTDDHVAVQDAWREVEEAIQRYETVKALCETTAK